jgi:hypothetical protein
MSIREIESFIKFIEGLIFKEENHLNWLYQKQIDLINNRKQYLHTSKIKDLNYTVESDINEMIKISENYLEHYKYRLIEYKKYRESMLNI